MVEIIKSRENYAANYGQPMLYYIPEWDDRVDPNYDFINDKHTPNRDPYSNDVYAHEIYDDSIYDGILLSKTNAETSKQKREKILEKGVHEFLRFPQEKPIMGDCGAFSYINEKEPPYDTKEIAQYYSDLGFDYGVSIDHLIAGEYARDKTERKRRYNLTADNAEEFLRVYQENDYDYVPIGIAQGWDCDSYKESVANLIQMGYQYIALGGLAKANTKEIMPILQSICPLITPNLKVHLFGVSRLNTIENFRKLGVTSFDSASYLRRAWLSSSSNYMTINDEKYTAIRIPQVDRGRKINSLVKSGLGSKEDFKVLEQDALKALRAYDSGEASLEETYHAVMDYEEKVQKDTGKYKVKNRIDKSDQNIDELFQKIQIIIDELNKYKLIKKNFDVKRFNTADNIFEKIVVLYDLTEAISEENGLKNTLEETGGVSNSEFKKVKDIFSPYHKSVLAVARHAGKYRKTLSDKPWQKCECKICQEIGIEAIIFRGNNRNRRRGFHNTYVFYKQFQIMLNSMN